MSAGRPLDRSSRLVSLDAYRGFVMLAMVSGGLGLAEVYRNNPSLPGGESAGTASVWNSAWETLAYQFSHVEWVGCSFWDLIQPSFMFIVGVAMPFSFARREADGQSRRAQFAHVLIRAAVLVALGVFLSSNWKSQTNFTFVNVLTQIGLGYPFVYLLLGRSTKVQVLAIAAILGGYWYFFYQYTIPEAERREVAQYVTEVLGRDESELNQFSGLAGHWNKHTNAAAAFDRWLLDKFPREEEPWHGRRFWVNEGGYQTLNFIPSIATMLLGVIAGTWLRSSVTTRQKLQMLLLAGLFCFLVALAIDTTIWPVRVKGMDWTFGPTVKRIWTPTWVLFSGGWTFWMLAAFYWVIDVRRLRGWEFPLVVVGMNSIAMYCMAQLLKPWISKTLRIHLTTVDSAFDTRTVAFLFGEDSAYSPLWESLARLAVLWLICLWLYRRRLFVRI